MVCKKELRTVLFASAFLTLAFLNSFLAAAIFLPQSVRTAAAHESSLAFDDVAVFSIQSELIKEIVPTEFYYWQSDVPLTLSQQKELLDAAQKGADGWYSFDYLKQAHTRYVWLTTHLPDKEYSSTALFFKTTNQAVHVWLDEKLIYTYGSMEEDSYNYGTRWHLVPLPAHYTDGCIVFGMHSFDSRAVGTFDHLCLCDMRASVAKMFFADMPFVFGLSLVFLMSAIVILYCFTLKGRRRAYLYLLFFLLDYALWMLSVMNAKYFLLDWSTFWWYVQLPTTYGFAIFSILFFAELLPKGKRNLMRIAVLPHIFLLCFSIFGEIFIVRGMMFNCLGIFFVLTIIFVPWVGYLLWQAAKSGNSDCRIALVPLCVVAPLEIFDSLWSHYRLIDWGVYITPFGLLSVVFFLLNTIRQRIRDEVRNEAVRDSLQHEVLEAKEKAQIDSLTKCFNRYKFDAIFPEWVQVAENTDGNLALLMLDIDFFKSVNDTYGHDEGDHVLKTFAAELQSALDRRHLLIRWGGEEFVILCLHYDLQQAATLADMLRERIAKASLCRYRAIECSIGVAIWHGAKEDTSEAFLKRADGALYGAKLEGRNRVHLESVDSLETIDGKKSK